MGEMFTLYERSSINTPLAPFAFLPRQTSFVASLRWMQKHRVLYLTLTSLQLSCQNKSKNAELTAKDKFVSYLGSAFGVVGT
jgi:hypothetical protein